MNYRLLLLILLVLPTACSEVPKSIPASSIGHDYILTGISNIPLGQTFVVEGRGVSKYDARNKLDERNNVLLVTSVNGIKLKKPTEAYLAGIYTIPANIVFSLRVIEDALYEESSYDPNPSPDKAAEDKGGQKLITYLHIIDQLSPKEPKLSELQIQLR